VCVCVCMCVCVGASACACVRVYCITNYDNLLVRYTGSYLIEVTYSTLY